VVRPKKEKWNDETELHFRLPNILIARIDVCSKNTGIKISRKEFIKNVLEKALYNEKSFANYMIQRKKEELARWQWEFEKHQQLENSINGQRRL